MSTTSDGAKPARSSKQLRYGSDPRTLGTTVKNAATYLRVSRADQSSALQADETSQLVSRREWHLVESFADEGISGATDKRPGFAAMMRAAKRRRFDVLVVWRTDRLFRSLTELVTTLAELESYGIGFTSVTEPFDTTTPAGRLLVQLVGAFAEFERNVLIERTNSGIAAARRRGVVFGRPRVGFDAERALELRAQGASYARIASALRVSIGTVHAAFKNPPRNGGA